MPNVRGIEGERHMLLGRVADTTSYPDTRLGANGDEDSSDMVVVITSDGDAFSDCPEGRPDSGIYMNSWCDW